MNEPRRFGIRIEAARTSHGELVWTLVARKKGDESTIAKWE